MVDSGYNFLAIAVATAVSVVIGMVWYAPPVLGQRWQRHAGVTQPGAVAFGVWVVGYFVLAVTIVYIFKHMDVRGAADGLRWGLTLGLTVIAVAVVPNYAFARKPIEVFLIEMGYVLVAVTVMGVILAAWR